jgi:hypothetical protein
MSLIRMKMRSDSTPNPRNRWLEKITTALKTQTERSFGKTHRGRRHNLKTRTLRYTWVVESSEKSPVNSETLKETESTRASSKNEREILSVWMLPLLPR